MADPLSPSEKSQLQDMDAFNRGIAAGGWHVRDKLILEDLSRIRLVNSTMRSVSLQFVQWNGAILENSQFTSVQFFQNNFAGAKLRGVVFTDCEFDVTSFSDAALSDCRFIRCRSNELKARRAEFDGCVFKAFSDRAGVFGQGTIRECRFDACNFDDTAFHSMEFVAVPFQNSTLNLVIFAQLGGKGLTFRDCILKLCAFGQSHFQGLVMERCDVHRLTFDEFQCDGIKIESCESIEALTVKRCSWETAGIADCQAISEWTVADSKLTGLSVERSRVAYLKIRNSELSAASVFSGCQIAGLRFTESALFGVRMADCELHLYLNIERTTFDGLVLNGIAYAAGLEFREAQAVYLNDSGRFRIE